MELDCLLKEDPPYGRTPSPSQLSTFQTEWDRTNKGTKACDATPADFMIHIAGTPKSSWNTSAGWAFTDHFIEKMNYNDTPKVRQKIANGFATRIKSLKVRHQKEGLPRAERVSEKSRHARRQRKRNVNLFVTAACQLFM